MSPVPAFEVVTRDLVRLARHVGTAMHDATESLMDADLQRAETVIDADAAADSLMNEIEDQCLEVLGTPGLEAHEIVGAMRIAASLERMGDLAEHVAKQARLRYPLPSVPDELRPTFSELGDLCQEIVSKTAEVIESREVELAGDIGRGDAEVDRLHRELFRVVLSPTWTHGVEAAIDVTLLSRYYERYADHAVSVTRRVVAMVTGTPYVGIDLG
mgnify:FL=1